MNSIDIDVGGTFTDLVLTYGGKTLIKKVPTTPYDLSVCFSKVIEEGASALGFKMEDLLPSIDMIRYSTTIAMNRLIERKGPRLGLGNRRLPELVSRQDRHPDTRPEHAFGAEGAPS